MKEVTVSSDQFYTKLTDDLWRQQQSGSYVDLIMAFNCGTTCSVHKCVISAMSRYMKLRIDAVDIHDKLLVLTDVKYLDFEPLLHFMYRGVCLVSRERVQQVIDGAELLELDDFTIRLKSMLSVIGNIDPPTLNASLQELESSIRYLKSELEVSDDDTTLLEFDEPLNVLGNFGDLKQELSNAGVLSLPPFVEPLQEITLCKSSDVNRRMTRSGAAKQLKTSNKSKSKTLKAKKKSAITKQLKKVPTLQKEKDNTVHKNDATPASETKFSLVIGTSKRSRRPGKKQKKSPLGRPRKQIKTVSEQIEQLLGSFHCQHCSKVFHHYSTLKLHLRTHRCTQVAMISYKNSLAKAKKSRPRRINNVINTQHKYRSHVNRLETAKYRRVKKSQLKTYSCKQCSKVFQSSRMRYLHHLNHTTCQRTRSTRNPQSLICQYCEKVFLHEKTRTNHIAECHSDTDESTSTLTYECRICTKSLNSSRQFVNHVTGHDLTKENLAQEIKQMFGLKEYICNYCKSNFTCADKLDEHVRNKHLYDNDEDAEAEPDIASLTQALGRTRCATLKQTATPRQRGSRIGLFEDLDGLSVNRTYRCPHCWFSTKRRTIFKRHLLSHRWTHLLPNTSSSRRGFGSRLYFCHFCVKVFLCQRTRTRHTLGSHSEKIGHSPIALAYTCRICMKNLDASRQFVIHLEEHNLSDEDRAEEIKQMFGLGEYICNYCTSDFNSDDSLKVHVYKKHQDKKDTQESIPTKPKLAAVKEPKHYNICLESDCDMTFVKQSELYKHVQESHPNALYTCTNDKCKYTTTIKLRFNWHMRTLHKQNYHLVCPVCGKSFDSRIRKNKHEYRKHGITNPELKFIKCNQCDFVGHDNYDMRSHSRSHTTPDQYCELCGKFFRFLESHMKRIHHKDYSFSHLCDVCGASVSVHDSLSHAKLHQTVFRYSCELCDYRTDELQLIKGHKFSKHQIGERVKRATKQCELCGFEARSPSHLTGHMNLHNNVKPFQCSLCDKSFHANRNLLEHARRLHTNNRFNCEFCSYSASFPQSIRDHTRVMHTHRDVKPYKCFYCDFRSATGGNCNKHIKQRHPGLPVKWERVCEKYPENHNEQV